MAGVERLTIRPAWSCVVFTTLLFITAGLLPAQTNKTAPRNPHGPLAIACENCHTTVSWSPIRKTVEFDHNRETKYPLRGMHRNVACVDCHIQKVFTNVSTQCADCHADIHRRQFGAGCQDCHTVNGWQVNVKSIRNHLNRFPLLGAHATLECEACHTGAAAGVYVGLSTECVSCHLRDFQQARPLNHVASNLPAACETCHTMDQWPTARFDHAQFARFALTGAHATLPCTSCHIGNRFQGTPADCYGCHARDFTATTNPSHVAAGFPHDCSPCHTTATWQGARFDHNATKFPLTGAHTAVQCAACHIAGRFAGTPQNCSGCHLADFEKTANPNHRSANFSMQCETCHTTANWQGAKFDHNTATKFALTGAHAAVACSQCHVNNRFAGTPMDCAGCHLKDFNGTTSPNHAQAGFPTACDTCHTTAQWTGAHFDHSKTVFPLTGAHVAVACAQCHTGRTVSTDCVGCHLPDFQKAGNPNHVAAGFPTACATCHTTTQWMGAKFDHNARTKFALTGAHASVACSQCHVGGKFAGTPMDCVGCHLTDFNKTTNPNHAQAGLPTLCSACHTTATWAGAQFDHSKTRFPLTGAHAALTCAQCHVGGAYASLPTDCASCHLKDFNKTNDPNHTAAGFPTTCATCHSTSTWDGAKFDHNTATKFALTGAHVRVACGQCHANNRFAGTPSDCAGCHLTDFNKTTNPNHVTAGFPTTCATCHSTATWTGATFDHSKTPFPLTGAHVSVACAQCHVGGKFAGTPTDCASCHLTDFNKTTNPNHVAASFPTTCAVCHTTTSWAGAQFDHSKTSFPLTGAHVNVACAQCHVGGKFAGTPTDCASCHLTDFNKTTNPNHKTAGFPTTCAMCHSTTSWAGAVFDHSKTPFPLTGAHVNVACAQCHVGGKFAGTTMQCAGCHQTDYNNTTNPNHKAAGFPTDCSVCHTTVNWQGAAFNHNTATKFPLTGAHINVPCAQCHVNNVFAGLAMDCASCHLADYNKTTNPNHKTAGFPTTCGSCHTTAAGWGGATFNHAATGFALTGAHASLQCALCHLNNNFNLTNAACINCHLSDYNGANSPPHKASGFPQDCSMCHSTVNWSGATFNHATTGFALTGFHATMQCAQCHVNNNYKLTSGVCANCHANDYNSTTNPPHKAAGFPGTCDTCHNTTSWAGATFDHSKTGFALTGIHATTPCASCHIGGNYKLTVTLCYTCHQTDYNNTNNPNHKAAGFPTTCETCHTTSGWTGATFNHTWFPEPHHTAKLCTDCHTNSSNYAVFVCTNCHTQGQTDPQHRGVKNYVWSSPNCYACHPRGNGG